MFGLIISAIGGLIVLIKKLTILLGVLGALYLAWMGISNIFGI